jgi:hypothetical protein
LAYQSALKTTKDVERRLTEEEREDLRRSLLARRTILLGQYLEVDPDLIEVRKLLETSGTEKTPTRTVETQVSTEKHNRTTETPVSFEKPLGASTRTVETQVSTGKLLRASTRTAETQVTIEELVAFRTGRTNEREAKLRARLAEYERRANLLLRTVSNDPEGARKEYREKLPEVRACYEELTEKILKLRKRIADEFGIVLAAGATSNAVEKREKRNKRRRELYRERREEAKKQKKVDASVPATNKKSTEVPKDFLIEVPATPPTPGRDVRGESPTRSSTPVEVPTTPPTPGREVPYDF